MFVLARIHKLDGDEAFDFVPGESGYSLFGNLLPEIAGFVIVGGQILNWIVMPI